MKPSLFLPLFLIIVGAIWFLRSLDLFPATSDIVAVILGITSVFILILEGINKQTLITSPLLAYIGASIYIYNRYIIGLSTLTAGGMILVGCLMLIARSDIVPPAISHKNRLSKD